MCKIHTTTYKLQWMSHLGTEFCDSCFVERMRIYSSTRQEFQITYNLSTSETPLSQFSCFTKTEQFQLKAIIFRLLLVHKCKMQVFKKEKEANESNRVIWLINS